MICHWPTYNIILLDDSMAVQHIRLCHYDTIYSIDPLGLFTYIWILVVYKPVLSVICITQKHCVDTNLACFPYSYGYQDMIYIYVYIYILYYYCADESVDKSCCGKASLPLMDIISRAGFSNCDASHQETCQKTDFN